MNTKDDDEYITGKELLIEFGKFLIWYSIVFVFYYLFIASDTGYSSDARIINSLGSGLLISGFSYLGFKLVKGSRKKNRTTK